MSSPERRNSIALDEAYFYCRELQSGRTQPNLYKVCNAIGTLDLALENPHIGATPVTLTKEAWQKIRDDLFDILVSSFGGYFMVYATTSEASSDESQWPATGILEFYPENAGRKNDSYSGAIERMATNVVTPLRWKYAQGEQNITPTDFTSKPEPLPNEELSAAEAESAASLLSKFYEICEEQASEGKKKAHRKWWQLYWEANACPNKRLKHELRKEMLALQSIWGKPQQEV